MTHDRRPRRTGDPRLARPPDGRGADDALRRPRRHRRACPPAPRPAPTRRSSAATAIRRATTGAASAARSRRSSDEIAPLLVGRAPEQRRGRRRAARARRHAGQVAPRRQRDPRRLARDRARRGAGRRPAAVAPPRRRRRDRHPPAADGEHPQRRPARRPPARLPGLPRDPGRRRALRRGAGARSSPCTRRWARCWPSAACSTLKADEGGYGPALPDHRAALRLLDAAVERAGLDAGEEIAYALDVAATHFFDSGERRLPARLRGAHAHRRRADRLRRRSWPATTRSSRSRIRSPRTTGRRGRADRPPRRPPPDRRRRPLHDRPVASSSAASPSAPPTRCSVKMNQIGTISETADVVARAHAAGLETVISARSGETEDAALADLAVGLRGGQIKIGSTTQSERLAKYNRLPADRARPRRRGAPGSVPAARRRSTGASDVEASCDHAGWVRFPRRSRRC